MFKKCLSNNKGNIWVDNLLWIIIFSLSLATALSALALVISGKLTTILNSISLIGV